MRKAPRTGLDLSRAQSTLLAVFKGCDNGTRQNGVTNLSRSYATG